MNTLKVVAIGGEPGSGKTTLMKRIKKIYGIGDQFFHDDVKLVPYYQRENLVILGKYEHNEVFGGTDKMSMACQPHVVEFLGNMNYEDDMIVFFEGDRLFNQSFLEHCNSVFDLSILYLRTAKTVRQTRYRERGSNQNETWLKGRETKIAKILANMTLNGVIETFNNNCMDDHAAVLKRVNQIVGGK
jgi:hypothetical protein